MQKLPVIALIGSGRIGRSFIRAYFEQAFYRFFHLAFVFDRARFDQFAYLLEFDSLYGRFCFDIDVSLKTISYAEQRIFFGSFDSENGFPDCDVDLFLDCTGRFSNFKPKCSKPVILSYPSVVADQTIILGCNESELDRHCNVISSASCTTYALAPLISFLDRFVGVDSLTSHTLHSSMNDQPLLDTYGADFYRSRSSALSMVPNFTALDYGIERLFPALKDKIVSRSTRLPQLSVCAMDVSFELVDEIDYLSLLSFYSKACIDTPYIKDLMLLSSAPLVSIDFKQVSYSFVLDLNQTIFMGRHFRAWLWFDNEWAYSVRLLSLILLFFEVEK